MSLIAFSHALVAIYPIFIAAGLQQNFITFSLHFGGCRIAVGLQKKGLHFNYIFITFLLHLYYIIAIEM